MRFPECDDDVAAVGNFAGVADEVVVVREFEGGVFDDERVGGFAGEFGADHLPQAADRRRFGRGESGFGFGSDHARLVRSRAAVSIAVGAVSSLVPLAPSSANLRAPGSRAPSKEPMAVL